ncbi:MAG TPA: sugar transferase, partial [Pirellulales bacterium]
MWISKILRRLRGHEPRLPGDLAELCSVERLLTIINRERARADRSGIPFSVLRFTPADRASDLETFACVAKVLKRRLRITDDAGWLGQSQLGVVLPDTGAAGANRVASDVQNAMVGVAPPLCEIYTYPTDVPPADRARSNGASQEFAGRNQPKMTAGSLEPFFIQPISLAKRALDILGASIALALASPVMVAAAIAIKVTSPGPIIYKQLRAGQGRQP